MNFEEILNGPYIEIILSIARALVYILLGILLSLISRVLIRKGFKYNTATNKKKTIAKLITSIIRYIIWFIMFMLILNAFNIQTGSILATAGVAGLAIGLGAQKLIQDFLSGFFIIFEESIQIGDVVEIDGFTGEVIDIGLRTVKLKNWKGVLKVINNGSITTIINLTRFNTLAIVDLSVAYESDIEQVGEVIKAFCEEYNHELTTDPAQYLGVMKLNDSGVDVRVIASCLPNQHYAVERDIRAKLKSFVEAKGIDIPFPQITINQK